MSGDAVTLNRPTGSDVLTRGSLPLGNPSNLQVLAGESGAAVDPVCLFPDRPTGAETAFGELVFHETQGGLPTTSVSPLTGAHIPIFDVPGAVTDRLTTRSVGSLAGSWTWLHTGDFRFSATLTVEDEQGEPRAGADELRMSEALGMFIAWHQRACERLVADLNRLSSPAPPAFSVRLMVECRPSRSAQVSATTEVLAAAPPVQVVDPELAPASVAAEVRELSGLDAGMLATIFGVSRTAYQNWIGRAQPHRARRERLHGLQALFTEARRRLGSVRAVEAWLLTPVEAGGKRPIDYLIAKNDAVVQGLLLREGPSAVRVVPEAGRRVPRRQLSPAEFARALEDLRPALSAEWDDAQSVGESSEPSEAGSSRV